MIFADDCVNIIFGFWGVGLNTASVYNIHGDEYNERCVYYVQYVVWNVE